MTELLSLRGWAISCAILLYSATVCGQSRADTIRWSEHPKDSVTLLADVPLFAPALTDTSGQLIDLKDLKGSVLVIDLWYTGCPACLRFHNEVFSKLIHTFRRKKNIRFIAVSIDRNRETWLQSIRLGQYASVDAMNLYTGGSWADHPFIQHYGVKTFPRVMLVGADGSVQYLIRRPNQLPLREWKKLIRQIR